MVRQGNPEDKIEHVQSLSITWWDRTRACNLSDSLSLSSLLFPSPLSFSSLFLSLSLPPSPLFSGPNFRETSETPKFWKSRPFLGLCPGPKNFRRALKPRVRARRWARERHRGACLVLCPRLLCAFARSLPLHQLSAECPLPGSNVPGCSCTQSWRARVPCLATRLQSRCRPARHRGCTGVQLMQLQRQCRRQFHRQCHRHHQCRLQAGRRALRTAGSSRRALRTAGSQAAGRGGIR